MESLLTQVGIDILAIICAGIAWNYLNKFKNLELKYNQLRSECALLERRVNRKDKTIEDIVSRFVIARRNLVNEINELKTIRDAQQEAIQSLKDSVAAKDRAIETRDKMIAVLDKVNDDNFNNSMEELRRATTSVIARLHSISFPLKSRVKVSV